MATSGAAYVVVIDMHQVRHSHPDTALIGQKVTEPIVKSPTVDIDPGSVGRSANGRVRSTGRMRRRMVGEVSAGILESRVSTALWAVLPDYAAWFAVALLIGGGASWLLARRLKKRTFGLELDEIAKLLQEREALLHGIREGVLAFDRAGRITMVNDEARLLDFGGTGVGGWLEDLVHAGPAAATSFSGAADGKGRGRAHRRLLPDRQPDARRAGRPAARLRRQAARPH